MGSAKTLKQANDTGRIIDLVLEDNLDLEFNAFPESSDYQALCLAENPLSPDTFQFVPSVSVTDSQDR